MNTIAKYALVLIAILVAPFCLAGEFEDTSLLLSQASYKEKAQLIEQLSELDDPRVLGTLNAMLDATLYHQKSTNSLITINKTDEGIEATALNSGELIGIVEKRDIKKVRINNKLRRVLKPKLAVLQLTSKDKTLRLSSAKDLVKRPSADLKPIIEQALENEENNSVRDMLGLAIAMVDVYSDDQKLRMNAIDALAGSVEPETVAALKKLSTTNEQGEFIEADTKVAQYATERLKAVESKVSLFKFFENVIFGFSLGSILLLAAIGLAITFGVMGVINMAHGEMIMLGAYTTFAIQQLFPSMLEWSLLMAIPAAFIVSGTAGVLIERLVIRHLYGRALDTLLATFGISLILQQAVRMYSSNNVAVITPEWLSGFYSVNGAMALTYNRIYILIFAVVVLGVLALVLKKTMMGLQMRAVTQNRSMANSMGIRSGWVDALTFGLGSGIAGIAGVALSQITNVGPNLGQGYIIDSFMVVVFGGVGNLLGTFFGALSLGLANKLLEPVTGAVVGKIIVLVFIILFIQWRPRGLFALKGRFVED